MLGVVSWTNRTSTQTSTTSSTSKGSSLFTQPRLKTTSSMMMRTTTTSWTRRLPRKWCTLNNSIRISMALEAMTRREGRHWWLKVFKSSKRSCLKTMSRLRRRLKTMLGTSAWTSWKTAICFTSRRKVWRRHFLVLGSPVSTLMAKSTISILRPNSCKKSIPATISTKRIIFKRKLWSSENKKKQSSANK